MNRFWDIECYDNLFLCGFQDDNDFIEMFYLSNEPQEVIRALEDCPYAYAAHDLTKDGLLLKEFMENPIPSDGRPTMLSEFLGTSNRIVKPKEDWYFAYNCMNYDIPMIDYVIKSMLGGSVRVSTIKLRAFSDRLIAGSSRATGIVKPYIEYGNHVDVAFLNETKIEEGRPIVGLKTLVGMLGGSIIESESNKTGHSKSVYDDTLYNINDIAELKHTVFPGFLSSRFKIKRNLLNKYPHLKNAGVTVNATSARFVEHVIAPEKPLTDMPVMDYMYPHPAMAKENGVEPFDALDNFRDWYMEHVFGPVWKENSKAAALHLAKFQSIYDYYSYFRNKNWNDSVRQLMAYGINPEPYENRKIPDKTFGVILPLLDRRGKESASYIRFSLGGIHGAEINQKKLEKDREIIGLLRSTYKTISAIPKGACPPALKNLIIEQSRTPYKNYPVRLSHEIPWFYQNTERVDEILQPEDFSPYMVKRKVIHRKDKTETLYKEDVLERYRYTSSGLAAHQDFESYYPVLMINKGTFRSEDEDKDRYADVKDDRVRVKAYRNTLPKGSKEYKDADEEQDGYKLILNSASGILDATHDTNVRGNNKAISMRSTGQFFTARIAMALALTGARVPSTNTDGVYAMDITPEENERVLKEVLKGLFVNVVPETLYLVSKDTNNRLEYDGEKLLNASGGTVSCYEGPKVNTSLAHPALVDRVLVDYLRKVDFDKPVDKQQIVRSLAEYGKSEDPREFLKMASWIMRSTSGSIFVGSNNQVYPGTIRVWFTTNGLTLSRINARKVKRSVTTDDYAAKLAKTDPFGKPETIALLKKLQVPDDYFKNAITVEEYQASSEDAKTVPVIATTKISGLSTTAKLTIDNRAISDLKDEEVETLMNSLDLREYVEMIATFAKTWHNS